MDCLFLGGGTNKRVCESGSSLYGFIEETIALDAVLAGGENINNIKSLRYLCSDISSFMNKGAVSFHSDIDITESTQPTIADLFARDIDELSLFYGLGVSLRYALRTAEDILLAAEKSELIVFNRISLTKHNNTEKLIYGTGKCEYIISLPLLSKLLRDNGFICRYCSENMQYNKDGDDSVRVSMIISKDEKIINRYEKMFEECINKCKEHLDCTVKWNDIVDLI